jgi:hypothetical protein
MDARALARLAAFLRTAKPCGPGTPTLVSSSWVSRGRWWLTSPAHQGDHGVTVTPSRRECRFVSGEPVVTTLACFVLLSHARLRVHRASGIPCALTTEGGRNSCKPRACGVARTRRCVLHSRHHPRMRVIQYAAASRLNRRRLWNTGSPAFAGDDNKSSWLFGI